MKTVTLYTKPYCSLCHKAEHALRALKKEIFFELVLRDITQDRELFERYRYDIPVITLDGEEICRQRVDLARVRRALAE